MAEIAIVYSTTDGHTRAICRHLARVLERHGQRASVFSIEDALTREMGAFDKIVLGASIRYGRHGRRVEDFIRRNLAVLAERPCAFFSVNATARKPGKDRPESNPYLGKFLRRIDWQPNRLAVFAGKIDYPRYRPWERAAIRLIMWLTGGPTATDAVVEFTDWGKVDAFARTVADM